MLPNILSYALSTVVIFISYQIIYTALRNRSAHKFFKKRSPNLPLLPEASLFGGHMNQVHWAKRSWKRLQQLHNEYGKTFAMYFCDKPHVSTIDLDLIYSVVLANPNDHVLRSKWNTPIDELEKDSLLTSQCEEQWRRLRNAIAPAFTRSKIMMPNVQSEIKSVINQLINTLDSRLMEADSARSEDFIKLDLNDMLLRYTNALALSCLYKKDGVVNFNSDIDHFSQITDTGMRDFANPIFRLCIMFPVLNPLVRWLVAKFHPMGSVRAQVLGYIKERTLTNLRARAQVKRRADSMGAKMASTLDQDNFTLNDGTPFRRNMMNYVIDQFQMGNLTESEYLINSALLFIAFTKTSTDASVKLLYHLAAHQDEQDKVRASIVADGLNSEYLLWAIKESLRLFPPIPEGCSRLIAYDILTKDGLLIPAGTYVHTPLHTIHRLPEYWGPDADEFKPERWRHSDRFHPVQYLAFGAGKRKCLGYHLAIEEIKMLISELLLRYKFNCAPGTNADSIMQFRTFVGITTSDSPTNLEIRKF